MTTYESTFHETGELRIEIPALSKPSLETLSARQGRITSIERDTSPTRPVTLVLGSLLSGHEVEAITGKAFEERLATIKDVLLGYQHARWLADQNQSPSLRDLPGGLYIYFPGLVAVLENGARIFPYANHGCLTWAYVGSHVFKEARIAIARA